MRNIIYGLVDPRTDQVRYIGQSARGLDRPRQHLTASSYEGQSSYHFPVYVWIRKLLRLDLQPEIVILKSVEKREELNQAERDLIAQYRKLGRLFNCTDGGDGQVSRSVSEETREKLRQINLGKKQSQKTIDKRMQTFKERGVLEALSERMKKRKETPEQIEQRAAKMRGVKRGPRPESVKEKLRQARLGKKQSPEAIEKMMETRKERGWTPPMLSEETRKKNLESRIKSTKTNIRSIRDQFNTVYSTMAEASRITGVSVGGIVYSLKQQRVIKGYMFTYADE